MISKLRTENYQLDEFLNAHAHYTNVIQNKVVDMKTNQRLAEVWDIVGLKSTKVSAGTVFYSGIREETKIIDPLDYLSNKHSVWLSQSAYWAGEYCYRESVANPHKLLIKVILNTDVNVLEFPSNFHPADAFFQWEKENGRFNVDYTKPHPEMRFEGAQPDHHIDKNFINIANLAGYQTNIHGYIRRAENADLGANPGDILELSLIAQGAMQLQGTFVPPKDKAGFRACIGEDKSLAGAIFFNQA